jgi:hypothetical protein
MPSALDALAGLLALQADKEISIEKSSGKS